MTSSTLGTPVPVARAYTYDGDGLLRSRTTAGLTTSFLWDASTAPAPLLQAGSDRVVHGLGPLYLARAGGSTLTLVRDALGSVRAEVTDAGVIAKAFRYAAYGEIVQPNPSVPTLLGFAGELRDPSGLIYLRARWYDVGTGRFTSRDPFSGFVRRPVSLNPYCYASAAPTRHTDPSGLFSGPSADTRGRDQRLTECLAAVIAFEPLSLAALSFEAAGLVLLGQSITIFGITAGAAAPVSAGEALLGSLFVIAGVATEIGAAALVYFSCRDIGGG